MDERGQVYFDHVELLPPEDIKRLEEAETRQQQRLRELLTDEAAERIERDIRELEERTILGG